MIGIGLIVVASLCLLILGMWIPFVLALAGMGLLIAFKGIAGLNAVGFVTWNAVTNFTLTAIPLYILMAELLLRSGLSNRLYRGLNRLTRVLPGGLLQTNIAGCAVFAAVSGSSVTTAATIGSVALPELQRRGYPMRMAYGSLAAGGSLGILIPPSIPLIVYGALVEASVVKLFLAGIVPGLLLALLFMAFVATAFWRRSPISEPVAAEAAEDESQDSLQRTLLDILPTLSVIAVVLVSLYGGWATPTEAAAVGCAIGLIFALFYGGLTFESLRSAVQSAVSFSAIMLFIVVAAMVFSYAVTITGAGRMVTDVVLSLELSKTSFLVVLILVFAVLGCLLESMSMVVITVPLLLPALVSYDIDKIWFGIFLMIMIELGQLTPPLGINLFVIQGISSAKFQDVAVGALPYCVLIVAFTLAIIMFPHIALWLPNL